MQEDGYVVHPVGVVESPLTDRSQAPRQGDEGASDCTIAVQPALTEAVRDVAPGTELLVLTWLDRASRDVLSVHPRGDPDRRHPDVAALVAAWRAV